MKYMLLGHARQRMHDRSVLDHELDEVIQNPQQIVAGDMGRKVYQSKFTFRNGRTKLLRVVVDETTDPALIISAYFTDNIDKYWEQES